MSDHEPLNETELAAIELDPMDFACVRGIAPTTLKLVAEIREQRRLLRVVCKDNDTAPSYELNVSLDSIRAIETYLAACEEKANDA